LPKVFFFSLSDCQAQLPTACKLQFRLHARQLNGNEVGVDHPAEPKGDALTFLGAMATVFFIFKRRSIWQAFQRGIPWAVKTLLVSLCLRVLEGIISILGLWHFTYFGQDLLSVWIGANVARGLSQVIVGTMLFSVGVGYTLVDPEGSTEEHLVPAVVAVAHFAGPGLPLTIGTVGGFLFRKQQDFAYHEFEGTYGWGLFVIDLIYTLIFLGICYISATRARRPVTRSFIFDLAAIGSLSVGSFCLSFLAAKTFPLHKQYTVFQICERSTQAVAQLLLARLFLSPSSYLKLCFMGMGRGVELPHGDSREWSPSKRS